MKTFAPPVDMTTSVCKSTSLQLLAVALQLPQSLMSQQVPLIWRHCTTQRLYNSKLNAFASYCERWAGVGVEIDPFGYLHTTHLQPFGRSAG